LDKPFAAYKGDDPYVFVCYAHEDSEIVYPEILWLHEQGVKIWYDEGISAGRIWRKEIAEAIQSASKFLYYISGVSLSSDHCNREVDYALDKGFDVVPVFLEETELTPELDLALNRVQALHRGQDTNYRAHLLGSLGQSTVPIEIQPKAKRSRNQFPKRGSVALILVLLVGVGWWYFPRVDEVQVPAPVMTEAPASDVAESRVLSVAVLPFDNMSNDPEQEFFSDGIAEDILNELARNNALTVRARSSSFSLKNQRLDLQAIGARLNVSYVLEGSVRRSGERLRVTVQLSDVDLDEPIWSDRYDREMTDLFAVQDEITAEVAAALSAEFGSSTPPRQTANTESYEAMLIGRHHMNRFDTAEALRWLTRAAELDPGNFEPWANIYKTRNIMLSAGYFADMEEYYRGQQNYADRVLARYPLHPEILAGQALTKFVLDRAYQESINELARLVQAQRNNLSAHRYLAQVLSAVGRHAESVRAASRVVEIDPLSPLARSAYVTSLLLAGRVAEARSAVNSYGEDASGYSRLHVAWAEGDVAAMRSALDAGTESPIWEAWAVVVERLEASSGVELASPSTRSRQESRFVQSVIAQAERRIVDALRINREAILAGDGFAIFTLAAPYPGMRATYADYYAHPGYQKMLIEFSLDVDSRAKITVPNLPF
jgi:TolB-like protein